MERTLFFAGGLARRLAEKKYCLILTIVTSLAAFYRVDHVCRNESKPGIRATRADDDLFQFQHVLVHISGHVIPAESQRGNGSHLKTGHPFDIPLRS